MRDSVDRSSDPNDLYGFRIRNRSSANFTLSKLQSNVNIELYALDKPRQRTLKKIGRQEFNDLSRRQVNRFLDRVAQSKRGGTRKEDITVDLDPGFYYLRVSARQKQGSRYRLTYQANPIPEVLPVPPEMPGGEMPGGEMPGGEMPGGEMPGGEMPGGEMPGGEMPGGELPGNDSPGNDSPGNDSPGNDSPGNDSPGTDSPGNDSPGTDAPGDEIPGGGGPGADPIPTPDPDDDSDMPDMPDMPDEPDTLLEIFHSGTGLPADEGWLVPQQFPVSETEVDDYLDDPIFSNPLISGAIEDLVEDAKDNRQIAPAIAQTTGNGGVTVDTRFFNDAPDLGYFGYSNYRPVLPEPGSLNLVELALASDPYAVLAEDISIEQVNLAFPTLDSASGYALEFDLTLIEESSADNRAGFSLTVIGNDGLGIELGFKADRIFAQAADLTNASEAEKVDTSFLGTPVTYRLAVDGSGYRLFANDSEILDGSLRDYNFDPGQSDPALPINPYETENLIFFGDNTDQGFANFTLGSVSLFT